MSSLETISVGAATKSRIPWPAISAVDTWGSALVERIITSSDDYFVEISDVQTSELTEDVSWFFTEEWQAKEREADEDFKRGDFDTVDTINELLALLDDKEMEFQKSEQKRKKRF